MKPNTVEFSKTDRLIYFCPRGDVKIPIAFVPVACELSLLINATSPWHTTQLCKKAYSYDEAQNADEVPTIRSDADRLTILASKRICYYARISGSFMRITKVENVSRNAKPNNSLGSTDWDISKMPADLVAAIKAIIANPTMPTQNIFGTYIPSALFKLIEKTSGCVKNRPTKQVVPGNPVTFEIDRNNTSDTYSLYKKVNGKIVWLITCAEIRDRRIVVNPIFNDLKDLINRNIPLGSVRNATIPIEDGEKLYRAFEASKIESEPRYRMALSKHTKGYGSVMVAQKLVGNDVIATVPVADLENGKITPRPGFESYGKLINRFLPGPYDHDVRDMDEVSGRLFFELKKKPQDKHSTPATDISPKVTDKKVEIKPLNVKIKYILI